MNFKSSFSLLLIIFSNYSFSQSFTPMRIVCIGNSITQGSANRKPDGSWEYSYRPWLWDKLKTDGFNVDMVGFHSNFFGENLQSPVVFPSNNGSFDRDNEAYYGITSSGFLNGDNSSGWTGSPLPKFSDRINHPSKGYAPDFALIHLGTNDEDSSPALINITKGNIREVIKILRAKNPKIVILLAKLITGWKKINPEIDGLCVELTSSSSPVISVDLAKDFINDPSLPGTMTYDWVHPNRLGQISMMRGWYKALVANLNDQIKPILNNKLVASNVQQNSVSLSWDLGEDNYGIKSYEVYANGKLLITLTNKPKFPIDILNLLSGTQYKFEVLAKDFGENSSDFISVTVITSGINSIDALNKLNKIKVFPTYTSSKLTINGANGLDIELMNIIGNINLSQKRIENDEVEIDLSGLKDGLYYLKIKDNDIIKIHKVVLSKF